MNALDQLRKLSSAEDFFDALGVSYDPAVLRVARLHILRRMGEYLYHSESGVGTDDEVWLACRAFLENAYRDFVESSPIEQRVFKVLKDAVKPKEEPKKPFVPLSTLVVGSPDMERSGSL
ncbi:Nitrogenase-stabilizing/protective protein NifW [Methylocella tundrae]|jgi:nitrogenase-stabilizing/protective protein|uniref:Nitrogenase-stabilizing/protective protein NifW n=1 Tax=Methylocella tundrae TaxID=227605 RepID=A0A8B6M2W0_METTU|nr:nitrogenase stabilizing/protective protein NifW [Methylocella tundrae]VTZ27036.1 Nitrogenase-stabilizing/protective protein NifW [Methylocella tundrae]VTZ48482.1 Nitrogenase-stabilizing/protective protein NifW [Methylocella tundrae]